MQQRGFFGIALHDAPDVARDAEHAGRQRIQPDGSFREIRGARRLLGAVAGPALTEQKDVPGGVQECAGA